MLSKKGKAKLIYSGPAVVVVVILAFALLHGTINAYSKMKISKEKRVLAESELREVASRYNSIEERVEYLETDKGVEDAIRTKYNVAKEGEEVFVIIDTAQKEEGGTQDQSFWTIFVSRVTSIFR